MQRGVLSSSAWLVASASTCAASASTRSRSSLTSEEWASRSVATVRAAPRAAPRGAALGDQLVRPGHVVVKLRRDALLLLRQRRHVASAACAETASARAASARAGAGLRPKLSLELGGVREERRERRRALCASLKQIQGGFERAGVAPGCDAALMAAAATSSSEALAPSTVFPPRQRCCCCHQRARESQTPAPL